MVSCGLRVYRCRCRCTLLFFEVSRSTPRRNLSGVEVKGFILSYLIVRDYDTENLPQPRGICTVLLCSALLNDDLIAQVIEDLQDALTSGDQGAFSTETISVQVRRVRDMTRMGI